MKLSTYRCSCCGRVVPLAEALSPPDPATGEQAKPRPCLQCGKASWELVR